MTLPRQRPCTLPEGTPGYVLVSGGKDSVATLHYLNSLGCVKGAIHLRTGISAPDTEPFVRSLCKDMGVPLEVYETPVPYWALVWMYGFPKGPTGHRRAFGALKDRPLAEACRSHRGEVFYTGVRKRESIRRFGNVRPCTLTHNQVHLHAAIIDWSNREVWSYLRAHDLTPSPCSITIGISGDCLCGSFSKPGECEAIRLRYPELAEAITRMEEDNPHAYPYNRYGNVKDTGFTGKRHRGSLDNYFCGSCDMPSAADRDRT